MANLKVSNDVGRYSSSLRGQNILPQVGYILPFAGPSDKIPSGWKICDGENGTPDMSDRFVVGSTTVGNLDETHTHTTSNSIGTANSSTPGNHTPSINVAVSIAANSTGHAHNTNGGRVPGAQVNDGENANRVTGNQANVIQNDHNHNTFPSANANSNSVASAHNHTVASSSVGSSVWSANHNHPISTSSSNVYSTTKSNLPAQYFVHFIMYTGDA
jgi:hypothetical protein